MFYKHTKKLEERYDHYAALYIENYILENLHASLLYVKLACENIVDKWQVSVQQGNNS